MKVKIFNDIDDDNRELKINRWFEDNPDINIMFVEASESRARSEYNTTRSKLLYIFYEEEKGVEL